MDSSIAYCLANGQPLLQHISILTTPVISDGTPEIDHFNGTVTMETI